MNLFPRNNRFFLLFFLLIVAAACTKIVTSEIGSGLIPPVDGVTTKDTTFEVYTEMTGEDTARVGLNDDHALGYIGNDPLFGTTKADINVQLIPSFFPYYFEGTNADRILDSVVLVLSARGSWGDSTQNLGFRVYEVSNEVLFTKDSVYRNTKFFERGPELTEFGTPKMVDPRTIDDSVHAFNEESARQVRIRLSESFGNKLLHDFDSSQQYKNDTLFRAALNGLQIKAEEMGNALLRINLVDTNTKVALYYRFKDTAGVFDTTVRYYRTSSFYSANSNYIQRNRTNAEVQQVLNNSGTNDSLLYLQTSPGLFATIKIPGLSGLSNNIIHRAELLMEQVPDYSSNADKYFTAPNLFLAAYSQDSVRRFAIPNDVQFLNGTVSNLFSFGVFPKSNTDGSGRTVYSYNFDMTRYVQGIVTRGDSAYDFQIFAPFNGYIYPTLTAAFQYSISVPSLNNVGIGRVRIAGGGAASNPKRMRLHVVYSLL